MRGLKTWAWASVIAVATASPAFAQTTTATTGTRTTGSITSGSTTTNQLGGGTASSGFGGTGGSGGNGGSGSNNAQMDAQPTISKPTGGSASSLNASNVFAGFYGNPYYQGKDFYTKNAAPGGFGMPLYTATSSSTSAGGRGANSGLGAGGRGTTNASNQSGIVIGLPVPINYTATMKFPTPSVAPAKLQADLRGVIDAGGLSAPKGVQIIANGTDITLRGTVKDDEEARLVEGLVRLTPGVGNITNELTFPVASK